MRTEKKRTNRIKPVALTLAVALIILLSAFAPKMILLWQDNNQLDTFTPIQQNLMSLGGDSTNYYYDLLQNTPMGSFTQTYETSDGAEIQQALEQTIFPKVEELMVVGLLPDGMIAYIVQISETTDASLTIFESAAGGFGRQNYVFEFIYDTGHALLDIDFDSNTGKITSLWMYGPQTPELAGQQFDYAAIFEAYTNWLDMGWVDDWEIVMEPSDTNPTYSAISVSYGLSANIILINSDDAVEFSYQIELL